MTTARRAHRGSSSSGPPSGAIILAGKIIDVDPLRWTCIVRTEGTDVSKVLYDVPLGGSYLHLLNGEGMYVMPDIGALVQVCEPSEGDSPPFIVAYRPYPSRSVATSSDENKPSATNNRPRMGPGDMAIFGRDRNGLFVRRGQVTEIFGGPLARTLYLGRTSTIHSICQVAKLDVFGGSARWEVDRPESDPDGHQATRLDLKMKEYADDRAYAARLQVGGSLDATTEGAVDGEAGESGAPPDSVELAGPVVRLRVYEDGDVEEADLTAASSLAINKGGEIELTTKGKTVIKILGSSTVTLTVNTDGTVTLDADTSVTTTAAGLAVTHTGDKVKVGNGTARALFDLSFSADAAAAWTEVSALAKALGLPSTNIDKHAASLGAQAYTAQKLETD